MQSHRSLLKNRLGEVGIVRVFIETQERKGRDDAKLEPILFLRRKNRLREVGNVCVFFETFES